MKIKLSCQYCKQTFYKYPSQIRQKKRLFCSPKCYYKFVSEKLPKEEQNAWKGGIDPRESSRRWKKKNKKKMQAMARARRLRELNAEGKHTKQEWEEIKEAYNNRCAEYKDGTCYGRLTKDHKIPLSMNGSNWASNLQPLCQSHNSRKSRKVYLGTFDIEERDID